MHHGIALIRLAWACLVILIILAEGGMKPLNQLAIMTMQNEAAVDALLRHVASKARETAQLEGAALGTDFETVLENALHQVDAFGVEGSTPVNDEEVCSCIQLCLAKS